MSNKLTHEQWVAFEEAGAADLRWRQVKLEAHAEAQRIVNEKIAQAASERDTAVRRAFDKGVRKSFFRKKDGGLHTTNQDEINKILERTEHLAQMHAVAAEAAADAAGVARYSIDADGYLVVTPPADDIAVMVEEINRTPAAFELDTVIPTSARFTVTKWNLLDPVDGMTIPGTIDPNPVTKWAKRAENQTAAVAWFKDQQEAAA